MISTRDLGTMPDLDEFRRITRALAMLDAIMSPEWEHRYYSFDSHWSDTTMMASMRNGHGDHWFAVLCSSGIALHGLAHEAPIFRPGSPAPEIFADLPEEFHASLLHEPAFDTANSTFCVWRRTGDGRWMCGSLPAWSGHDPDGSLELLTILEGKPKQYVEFASWYFEQEIAIRDVEHVYAHRPLTEKVVQRLNPNATLGALQADIEEIGFPALRSC